MREPAISNGRRSIRARLSRRLTLCAALALIAAAAICVLSYLGDVSMIRAASARAVVGAHSRTAIVLGLNEWVHRIDSTARNESYFFLPQLRASPVQVLEGGGDCADKSRLLWAALRAHGIPATMAMLFHPETNAPTHTVVEARIGPNHYMLADPAYNLVFPNPEGTFYDMLDLRANPSILDRRLNELLANPDGRGELRAYRREMCGYSRASSINWNRNALTHSAHSLFKLLLGENVYRLPRPMILEEPKLAVATLTFGLAVILATAPLLMGKLRLGNMRLRLATTRAASTHVIQHGGSTENRAAVLDMANTHVAP